MTAFEPAPAAVARIGSKPIEALESLSSPELAQRALDLDERAFEAEYQRVLERHRHELWRHTAGDARMRCGLALSSPSLEAELHQPGPSPRRNKRARHLDTSLYRYLARAVGRLEPCGLWTSVTLASLGSDGETTVGSCAAKCHVAPDLGPFRELVQALGRHEPYRSRGPYRLDPTLQIDASGGWIRARRDLDGRLAWVSLPRSAAWRLLATRFGDGRPRSLAEMKAALVPAVSEAVAVALLDHALEVGLLVGGLRLPVRFETVWEALELMEDSLEPPHREPWHAARVQVARVCTSLERALDGALCSSSPSEGSSAATKVIDGQRRVREELTALAKALDVPCPGLADAVLRCDETAPFRIDLGTHDRTRLEGLLEHWAGLERRHRTDRRWARGAAEVARASGGRVTAVPVPGADPRRQSDSRSERPQWCGGPPLGAFVVRPGADGFVSPHVRGLSQSPTVTHARHAYHLADRGDVLLPWFRAAFRELEHRHGVEVVDLVCSTKSSPNLQARPSYVERTLDPWGASRQEPGVDQLRLVPGPSPSALLLAHGERRISAQVFTPLVIPGSDVITRRLAATSFDDRAFETTAADEAPADEPADAASPEPADAVMRRPQPVRLTKAETEHLLAVRGAARFVRWQQLVRRHGWSRWVRIQCGTRPSLLVPTDGPLPIEAVLEGVRVLEGEGAEPDQVPAIVVEELLDGAWLPGPDGHHFVELVLPVRRACCAFTRTVAPEPELSHQEDRDHGRL